MKTRITMSDIAKELGVSTVTVSRALSGKEGVSGALEAQIRHRAERLGYRYNGMPKNMLTGRYNNIGILIGEKYLGETSYYWLFFLKLLHTIKERKYMGVLEVVTDKEEASQNVPFFLKENKVDGLILLGQMSEDYLTMIHKRAGCAVFLDFYSDLEGSDCIASNNFLASYKLTKLLIDQGHRKIAFLGASSVTTSTLDRYMGFCKAMIEKGLPYDEGIPGQDSRGYSNISLDLSKYTAYVCNNDLLAGLVIRQIRQKSMKVPGDISVVGFDNADPAITDDVGVTSVETNIDVMCKTAVNAIIKHIEHENYTPQGKVFIEAKIIEKQSISPPKPAAP
jgi:LacI family transcriptional regulator